MCKKIVINCGEKEIESPRQFEEYFGFPLLLNEGYTKMYADECLCPADIEKTLNERGIKFEKDCLDYNIEENQ